MMIAEMPRAVGSEATKIYRSREEQLEEQLEEQFREMVEAYSGMAYNIALRMLRNTADAEDAVQEAFISAYRAFPKFKGQSKVSTWFYRIVVNACLMKIRQRKGQTGRENVVVRE